MESKFYFPFLFLSIVVSSRYGKNCIKKVFKSNFNFSNYLKSLPADLAPF